MLVVRFHFTALGKGAACTLPVCKDWTSCCPPAPTLQVEER